MLTGQRSFLGDVSRSDYASLLFSDVDSCYAAAVRVIGSTVGATQTVALSIKQADGSLTQLSVDATSRMLDFNEALGGDDFIIEIRLGTQLEGIDGDGFTIVIKDWIVVGSGDNSDLEI